MDESQGKRQRERIGIIDDLRGLSVVVMIYYHGLFLLDEVFGITAAAELFKLSAPLQVIFSSCFIVLSGVSANLSRSNAKRGARLLGFAAAITAVTCFVLPRVGLYGFEIRFGILHMLSLSMLLFALIQPVLKKIPPAWGFALFLALYLLTARIQLHKIGLPYVLEWTLPDSLYNTRWLFPLGLPGGGFKSADYFPMMPYFFLFAAGSFMGRFPVPEWSKKTRSRVLAFLGRNSLWIYIAHQPVLMGIFLGLDWLTRG